MHWFVDNLKAHKDREAIIDRGTTYTYNRLSDEIENALGFLRQNHVGENAVVSIVGDYSFHAIAMFFALVANKNTVVPITSKLPEEINSRIAESYTDKIIRIEENRFVIEDPRETKPQKHELFTVLKEQGNCGLILFSSGSTGKPKAMLEDLDLILSNYKQGRASVRTLVFLMFDHIGGVNTMFHILSSGGCMIIPPSRHAEDVMRIIEQCKVEILPTSPTFLNLLLISEAYKNRDLSSLKIISYGTEPMPPIVLNRIHDVFPHVKLKQTYGLSEVGILSTKSKSSDSLYMKIGGDNFEHKIIDNQLYIKSKIAMLGYLNAPSPFTEDGWFPTGDTVDVDEEGYIRIFGRLKEFINVGGQKVLPSEVEGVILEVEEVKDVMVKPEKNPIMGEMVVAEVSLKPQADKIETKRKILQHCKVKLEDYKVPMKIKFVDEVTFGERFKKIRSNS
jgi:acyl-coenzyme A synthetase/AMP-(fatty) acid ligase